ncbi:MAG: hypothetical protein OEY44_01870, partial [Candidatus Peregrinibacteria bacterium]|nr:hypothetical protein [Candidatus Peregrinibacteria bacterium]
TIQLDADGTGGNTAIDFGTASITWGGTAFDFGAADLTTTGDLFIGTTGLSESNTAGDNGASLIGVDATLLSNSINTNLMSVLDDLDAAISTAASADDANTLDTLDSTQFVRSDASDTIGADDNLTQTYTLGGTGATFGDIFNLAANATFNTGSGDFQIGGVSVTATAGEINDIATATDLASNANGLGAATIGVEDSAANFTATTVEGVLAELFTLGHTDDQDATEVNTTGTYTNFTGTTVEAALSSIDTDLGTKLDSSANNDSADNLSDNDLSDLGDVTLTTIGNGDLLVRNSLNNGWVNLAEGTAGQILTTDGNGTLSWTADDTGTDDQTASEVSGVTAGTYLAGGTVDDTFTEIDSEAAFLAGTNVFTSTNTFSGAFNIGTTDVISTVNIATNGTSADTVSIGNSNAATTVAITGGDDWAIDATGIITGATWNAGTIGTAYLDSTVMLQGENVSLLANDAGYLVAADLANSDVITYTPEYANTTFQNGGTGVLSSDLSASREAYIWTTTGSAQSIEIHSIVPVPADYASFTQLDVDYRLPNGSTVAAVAVQMFDESGVSCGTAVADAGSATWATITDSAISVCTLEAGNYIEIVSTLTADSAEDAVLGQFRLTYTN